MKQSLGAAGRMWQDGGTVEVSCVKSRLEEQATVVFRLMAPLSNRYRTLVNQNHLTCPERADGPTSASFAMHREMAMHA